MILVRSPLRISLGGGGTDLPSYYNSRDGFVIAAAIDKYIYVAINKPFTPGFILKYSKFENVSSIQLINHPIVRESLKLLSFSDDRIEISSMADIPSGTGLGSSGSFTTALLKALATYMRYPMQSQELAKLACNVEIELLGEPVGKQDQYIAAYGGITAFSFNSDQSVKVEPLKLSSKVIHDLEDNLLLFFTSISRSASVILDDQNSRSKQNETEIFRNLDFIKEIGFKSREALIQADTYEFAELMNQHWQYKISRSNGMSSQQINNAYEKAMKNGAIGGKLVGAGGGGFLMFYASDPEKLRHCMNEFSMPEVRFKFDFQGTHVMNSH